MTTWVSALPDVIRTAINREGGVIVVDTETKQIIAADALSRLTTTSIIEKIGFRVDPEAQIPYYESKLGG